MNRLYKSPIVNYVPGTPYIPAVEGRPARPARDVWEETEVCGWTGSGETTEYAINDEGAIFSREGWTYRCRTERTLVHYAAEPAIEGSPAIAATPAQILTDLNVGWTGGARSIGILPADGYLTFSIPRTATGVFAGLNDTDQGVAYLEIDYAIYVANGGIRIYELGVEKAYLGSVATSDVFKIRRRFGQITYLKNDVVIYTSATASSGPLFADTSLYTAGDYVDNPAIVEEFLGSCAGSFSPMVGVGSDADGYSFSAASFLPMTGASRVASRCEGSLSPMTGLAGNRTYGRSQGAFEPMTGYTYGNLIEPSFAVSAATMMPMMGYAHGLTGEVGGASPSMQPMVGFSSDHAGGRCVNSFEPMRGYSHALDGPNGVSMLSRGRIEGAILAPILAAVVMNSTAEIAGLLTVESLADLTMLSDADAASTYALQALRNAQIFSQVSGMSTQPLDPADSTVWVVNATTAASTRYEDYAFNSFAEIDGVFYGAKADGIYRLDGEDDAGAPVQAMVSFGKQGFGTSQLKRVDSAYLGVSATGRVFLRVTANGESYTYAARHTTEMLETQRVDIGKGLRATFFEFELYNEGGADFELSSVEFEAIALSRRI